MSVWSVTVWYCRPYQNEQNDYFIGVLRCMGQTIIQLMNDMLMRLNACNYVAAKATYIRLLHGKIGFLGFFGPSSVKRGRTHIVLG